MLGFFLLHAEQEADGHLTKLCSGRNFLSIISYVSLCQKMPFFFVKCGMPILFPVNCERTNLSSVKRDLDPPPPPPFFTTLAKVIRRVAYGAQNLLINFNGKVKYRLASIFYSNRYVCSQQLLLAVRET